VGALASDTPSDGQVPKWNTGGTITWENDQTVGSSVPELTVGVATLTNNLSVVFQAPMTTFVNLTNAFRTNTIAATMTITHASNGIAGQLLKSTVAFYNGSGSDQTLTIPSGAGVGWQTNTYSQVPSKLTNGYTIMMYLTSLGLTDTAARQTNVLVSFDYYAKP